MDSILAFRMATPSEMTAAESWLPALFCGQAGRVARMTISSRRLGEAAIKCLDGWRTSSDPDSPLYDELAEDSPRYRQANIGIFAINMDAHHCLRPIVENQPYCVLPGDVLTPRIPPLRAALVSDSHHRHPIDGNCFIVRGLSPLDAAWLLALLNEKEYEAWFVARSGSQALPRIGLKDLRQCPFPEPPQNALGWSSRLFSWVEAHAENAARLFSLKAEVSDHVSRSLPEEENREQRLFPGVREPAALLDDKSWLPEHIEAKYQQHLLLEKGMLRLKDLVTRAASASARLKDGKSSTFRLLGLKNVTGIYLPTVRPSIPETRLGRFFSEPVQNSEVLISSLVSNPKVAYADPSLSGDTHPTDHWLRISFRETPGAWALVLASPVVAGQFKRMATGSALQFATAERLMELCVPGIDRALRNRWQNRLDGLLADRRHLDKEWEVLRLEGRQMVASVLDIPTNEIKERALE